MLGPDDGAAARLVVNDIQCIQLTLSVGEIHDVEALVATRTVPLQTIIEARLAEHATSEGIEMFNVDCRDASPLRCAALSRR